MVQLAAVEAMLHSDAPDWLSANTPSVLSHYLGMLIRWVSGFPAYPDHRIDLSATPVLQAMLAQIETRPAVQVVARAEGVGPRPYTDPLVS